MSFKFYNDKTNKWSTRRAQEDVVHVIMDITPEIAKEWLEDQNTNNRKLRNGMVNKYVTAIMSYGWYQTNHSIGFYRNGVLADGQHTLWAVVKTQKTIRYTVTFNIDPEASDVIDDNGKRSTPDHGRVLYGDKASSLALQTMNYTLSVHGVQSKITKRQEMDFYEKNKVVLEKLSDIVADKGKTQKVTVSPVLSAIFTAIKAEGNPVKKETAYRFLEILCGDTPVDDREKTVTRLREWLIRQTTTEKGADRSLTYWQTQKVLKNFTKGKVTKGEPRAKDKSKRSFIYVIAIGDIPHPKPVDNRPDEDKPQRTYGKRRPKTTNAKTTIFKVSVEQQG